MATTRRRYVARGRPGGYQVWDNKRQRWWGEVFEFYPQELLDELNGAHDTGRLASLLAAARRFHR